jgi:ribosomal protein S1
MNFVQLFSKSNLSLHQLRGNVIQCSVQQIRGNIVILDTGLNTSTTCFQSELNTKLPIKRNTDCILGIENVPSKIVLPKYLEKITRRNLVWTELTQIWRSFPSGIPSAKRYNRVKGFLLNSVNGGYAVAIAGHIAFLPRSLRRGRSVFHSQWRTFSILNMNPKIGNIVVKEIMAHKTEHKRRSNSKQQKDYTALRRRKGRQQSDYTALRRRKERRPLGLRS